jgi:ABC-2 type transport system permease protein
MMDWRNQFTGFQTIVIYTVRKLLLSKRIYITLGITLLVTVIAGYASTTDVVRLYDGTELLDRLVMFFFMPIIAMIYGSSLIRDEMDDRSITQVVTSPLDRIVTFTAYYLGLAISVSVAILLILTAGFLVFFGSLGMEFAVLGIYGPMAVMVVIGSFAYSALFIMVSVLISQPIYFGLFYAFIWEALIGSIEGNIRLLAVKHYVRSLGTDWIQFGGIADYDATSVGGSAWVLLVFAIVTFVIGALLFRDQEFP